jgi:hypothetical protein
MSEKRCVKIRIEFADGEMREATGKDAEAILDWWNNSVVMNQIHGARYNGPELKIVRKAKKAARRRMEK